MLESKTQKKIRIAHEKDGWLVVKLIQTTMNGIPDLMLLKAGRVVFVEIKRVGEKPSPLQEYVHSQIRKKGIDVFWTSNPEFHL